MTKYSCLGINKLISINYGLVLKTDTIKKYKDKKMFRPYIKIGNLLNH